MEITTGKLSNMQTVKIKFETTTNPCVCILVKNADTTDLTVNWGYGDVIYKEVNTLAVYHRYMLPVLSNEICVTISAKEFSLIEVCSNNETRLKSLDQTRCQDLVHRQKNKTHLFLNINDLRKL